MMLLLIILFYYIVCLFNQCYGVITTFDRKKIIPQFQWKKSSRILYLLIKSISDDGFGLTCGRGWNKKERKSKMGRMILYKIFEFSNPFVATADKLNAMYMKKKSLISFFSLLTWSHNATPRCCFQAVAVVVVIIVVVLCSCKYLYRTSKQTFQNCEEFYSLWRFTGRVSPIKILMNIWVRFYSTFFRFIIEIMKRTMACNIFAMMQFYSKSDWYDYFHFCLFIVRTSVVIVLHLTK